MANLMSEFICFNWLLSLALGSNIKQIIINKAAIINGIQLIKFISEENGHNIDEAIIVLDNIKMTIVFDLERPKTIGNVLAGNFLSPSMSSMSLIISLARFKMKAKIAKPEVK